MSEPDLREAARYFFREPHALIAAGGSSSLSTAKPVRLLVPFQSGQKTGQRSQDGEGFNP
jgi:alcohol dehydrogenase class IV